MRLSDFDFDLPSASIALKPARPRDSARLLCVSPNRENSFQDKSVSDLPDLLEPGDCLVLNDTRVIPAALSGIRQRGGVSAAISVTLHKRIDERRWAAFARPAKRLTKGDRIDFGVDGEGHSEAELQAEVAERGEGGEVTLAFDAAGPALDDAIAKYGAMPLPPYIASKRQADAQDTVDYQTVFAARKGAVAAPTAGLHFTPELLEALKVRGIGHRFVTLHVGAGTFLPVKEEDPERHEIHAEWGEVSAQTAQALNDARSKGGRLIAVGTTALRLIESAARSDGTIEQFADETTLFIRPGYRFKAIDRLITNFHLPRTTLFMLVAAFSGLDVMQKAYAHAVAEGYRFFSYGDACLLDPARDAS